MNKNFTRRSRGRKRLPAMSLCGLFFSFVLRGLIPKNLPLGFFDISVKIPVFHRYDSQNDAPAPEKDNDNPKSEMPHFKK